MKIYNIKDQEFKQKPSDGESFIYGTYDTLKPILQSYGINISDREFILESIKYELHQSYDHFSFVFYTLDSKFKFTNIKLILTPHKVFYIVDDDDDLNVEFIEYFVKEKLLDDLSEESLQELFYELLSLSLKSMFDTLLKYEDEISKIEDAILISKKQINLNHIVQMKNDSLNIKKYNRQLLYIGDLLLMNKGSLGMDETYLQNLDSSINKLYEYSNNVYEMSNHLMELYDSKLTANTNDTINKLTIFTVFATPLTVITGIYGMNFVHMPELQHAYGYYIAIAAMIIIDVIIYFILKKSKLL